MTTLNAVPDEVLENVAFFAGTVEELGPPSALLLLLTLNKRINRTLAFAHNPHLYARIFASKFDVAAPLRRLGAGELTAPAFAAELRQRCTVLSRIRAKTDCLVIKRPQLRREEGMLDTVLWAAYLMMLENDGKNMRQLREYARIDEWLRQYWFHKEGASYAHLALETGRWPMDDNRAALAMWLFWFFLDPRKYASEDELLRRAFGILKPFALGAHKYPLSRLPWHSFAPQRSSAFIDGPSFHSSEPFTLPFPNHLPIPIQSDYNAGLNPPPLPLVALADLVTHFSLQGLPLTLPPAAVPAILSYLALRAQENQMLPLLMGMSAGIGAFGMHLGDDDGFSGFVPGLNFFAGMSGTGQETFGAFPKKSKDRNEAKSEKWDCEWAKCLSMGEEGEVDDEPIRPERTFKPGSVEGVWEGVFTYTEFTLHAALLSGAPPSALQSSLIAQHRQTWKIREHHLLADVPFSPTLASTQPFPGKSPSDENSSSNPVPAGDSLRAHLPEDAIISENPEGLCVTIPASPTDPIPTTHAYRRYTPTLVQAHERTRAEGGVSYASRVRDIVLTGEGHSSWGEFSIVGRVRRCDGFVSLSKEYTDGDRGRWLYRGYLVGAGSDGDGNLVGRWRDTLTPPETHGYEGCFGMTRRR